VRKAANLGAGVFLGAVVAYREGSLIEGAAVAAVVIFIVGPVFAGRLIPGSERRGGGIATDLEGDSDFDTDGGGGGELTLRPRRLKHLLLAALCAALACTGIFMIRSGESGVAGWVMIVFSGLGVAIFTVRLVVPGACFLRLSKEGFTVRNLFWTTNVRWSDVTGFAAHQMEGHAIVVFNFTDQCRPSPRVRLAVASVGAFLGGFEASIPDIYDRSAEDLAQILNDWKHGIRRVDT
jgi:hypothetical protein